MLYRHQALSQQDVSALQPLDPLDDLKVHRQRISYQRLAGLGKWIDSSLPCGSRSNCSRSIWEWLTAPISRRRSKLHFPPPLVTRALVDRNTYAFIVLAPILFAPLSDTVSVLLLDCVDGSSTRWR